MSTPLVFLDIESDGLHPERQAWELANSWPERFRAKVAIRGADECWEWLASVTNGGYGRYRLPGRHVTAHRFGYERAMGAIPEGLDLDHLCRNRRCVNPRHLEPVSERENTLRGESFAAVNARKTHCHRGHPLSGDNVYVWHRMRACRTCSKVNRQRYEARRKASV